MTDINLAYLTDLPVAPARPRELLEVEPTITGYLSSLHADIVLLGPFSTKAPGLAIHKALREMVALLGLPANSIGPYRIFDTQGTLAGSRVPEAAPAHWTVADGNGEVSESADLVLPRTRTVQLRSLGSGATFEYDEPGTWELLDVTYLVFAYRADRYTPSPRDTLAVVLESASGRRYGWKVVDNAPISSSWRTALLPLGPNVSEEGEPSDVSHIDKIRVRVVSGNDEDYDLLLGYFHFVGNTSPAIGQPPS